MTIHGLHHITLVTADAPANADFYTRALGLRLVKKTVNFDDPTSYHLYYGNGDAAPGSLVTFFEWPTAPKGRPGIGGTHHFALTTRGGDTLRMWKRRLTDLGHPVKGPYDRRYFTSIYFRDPDGQVVEIATEGPGFTADEAADALGTTVQTPPAEHTRSGRDAEAIAADTWPEPVDGITPAMQLQFGMHHISAISSDIERTDAYYSDLLGLRRVKKTSNFDDPNSAHWYWGDEAGRPGTLITYFEHDPDTMRRVRMGAGQTHHFAFAVKDEEEQLQWRERLVQAGLPVSPVMDRVYFKSIYTRDPDGHIVELATLGPGFLVDEDAGTLGTGLMLPSWLESKRDTLAGRLTPIEPATWAPA